MLNMTKNMADGVCTYVLEGRLDTVTAPELEKELKTLPEEELALVLDFEKLSYISSAGLRVLLSTQKARGARGGMILERVNDTIMEIFDVTGFSEILTIR